MKNSKHLKFDEVVALIEKRWELLPETMDHISSCDQCSELILEVQEMTTLVKSQNNIRHIPDAQKIESIASKSFALLHEEIETDEVSETFFDRISSFISSWIKPVAIAGAAAAVAIVVYNSNSSNDNSDSKIADNKPSDKEVEKVIPQDTKLFKAQGIKEAGTEFKSNIAKIKTIKPTYFSSMSENEILMKKGKARFDIVSGNDFRINVNDSFIVRVLGTSFVVDFNDKDFSVKVFEGLVEIINKKDNSVTSLTKDMEKTYTVNKKKDIKIAAIRKLKPVRRLSKSKMNITPDASFLTQGREALKAGKTGAAIQLFIMELEKGKNKDKALFETVRIYEKSGKHKDMVGILKSNMNIVSSSRVYKEELLIKGCMAQYKNKSSSLSFCKDYLNKFPHGYRKDEIEAIVND